MKDYRQKDGMLMIWRAIIMTVIALVVCWAAYKMCKPVQAKPEIYVDEDGFYYDISCLEQRAFERLIREKMKEKSIVERK
jgi:hypothetical protein